jgi:hypothetical protein
MVLENVTSIVSTVDINYLFGSIGTILALSACVAGGMFQTIIKWWDKWQDGQPIAFDKKFIGTAVASFIAALTISVPLMNAGTEVLNANIPTYGLIMAWFITAGWAYALNNGVNGIVTKLEQKGVNNLVKSGKLDLIIEEKVEQRVNTLISQQQQVSKLEDVESPKGVVGGEDAPTQPGSS